MTTTTMITTTTGRPHEGTTDEGRPVRFSQPLQSWVYNDTPADDPVEQVQGQVHVRKESVEAIPPALVQIAGDLGFEVLHARHSDRLDFREVGVNELRDALLAAYWAGR
jgi:hypothetical protein